MIKALTLPFLLACTPAVAQCTIAVPATAIAVTTIQGTLAATGQFIWICAGGLAAVTGNGNTVVVEEMGTGTLIGDNNVLVSKAPGTYVSGNNNTVYIADPADVADLGTNTQITACPVITFTYSDAPSSGCLNVAMAETAAPITFDMFPNPASRQLTLATDGARIERVRVYDMRGTIVLDRSGTFSGKLDVSKFHTGMFVLVADTERGQVVRRLVKE